MKKLRQFIKRILIQSDLLYSLIMVPFQRIRLSLPTHFGKNWRQRIEIVLESGDNDHIDRHPDAGKVKRGWIIMHNGQKVWQGSYYDYGNQALLMRNRGVHEPQEERAFGEILQVLPESATMVELGAYWAFYSMWFSQVVDNGRCYLIEPDALHLSFGERNFRENDLVGTFVHAAIGSEANATADLRIIAIDEFVQEHEIDRLHLLHSDIQGAETKMLAGCDNCLRERKIDYIFLSTHSNALHDECLGILHRHEYLILASSNIEQSYSYDGLIVAKAPGVRGPDQLDISLRTPQT